MKAPSGFWIFTSLTAIITFASCHASERTVTLHTGDVIVAEGDSLTYGQDFSASGHPIQTPFNGTMNNRSNAPYPETLQKLLHDKVTVENHGYPGDRTIEGIARWAGAKNGNLTLIMYGTNDCWNFNGYPSGKQTIEQFKNALTELVIRRQHGGAKIILLTPPPLQTAERDEKLNPYREAVKQVAKETNALIEDTVKDLQPIPTPWVDGVHLSPQAYETIAKALATRIQIKD